MRLPVELFWKAIGDSFRRIFRGRSRRRIEALWEGIKEVNADILDYVEHVKSTKNIFQVTPYAPYGQFPVEPSLVSDPISRTGIFQGGRSGPSYRWYIYFSTPGDIPSEGTFNMGYAHIDFSDSRLIELDSGGYLLEVSSSLISSSEDTADRWDIEDAPSYVFGPNLQFKNSTYTDRRWDDQGAATLVPHDDGLRFEVTGLQWGILSDEYYYSGSETYRQIWRVQVEEWPDNQKLKAISVNSFDDNGNKYICRLWEDNKTLHVEFGADQQNTNHLSISGDGSTSGWRSKLVGATADDPATLEFVVKYSPSKLELLGQVYLDGEAVVQPVGFTSISPGRRTHTFDVFSAKGQVDVTLDALLSDEGSLWDRSMDISRKAQVSNRFNWIWGVSEDLVESAGIRHKPWDLTPVAEVRSWVEDTLLVTVKPAWAEYAPKYLRLEDGSDFAFFERLSRSGREAEYKAFVEVGERIDLSGEIELVPWYLKPQEVTWVDDGRVATKYEIPSDTAWLDHARGREVNLYGRYGRILDIPQREDSEAYLSTLRGMHYGLLTEPTPDHLRRALSMTLNLPFTINGGLIDEIEKVEDTYTGDDALVVRTSEGDIQIDGFWSTTGDLRKPGEFLDAFQSLVDGVEIVDWRIDADEVANVVGEWQKWGYFLVYLRAFAGLDLESLDDVRRLIERSKNRHHGYKLLQKSVEDVDATAEGLSSHAQHVYKSEDLLFDDGGTVVNNGTNNPEGQSGSKAGLNARTLEELISLDDRHTVRPLPSIWSVGRTLNREVGEDHVRMHHLQSVDIKRALEPEEQSAGFGRATLRMHQTVANRDGAGSDRAAAWPRSYTLLWLYDASSGTNLKPTRSLYPSEEYDAGSSINNDITMPTKNTIHIAQDGGVVQRSTDYGRNFSSTNPYADDVLSCDDNWAGGRNGSLAVYTGGSWSGVTNPSTNSITDVSALSDQEMAFVASDGSGNTEVFHTTDQGSSWTTVSISSHVPKGVSLVSGDKAWVTGDTGTYLVDFSASSDSLKQNVHGFAVSALSDTKAVVCGGGGLLSKTTDGGSSWVSIPPTNADINDVDWRDDDHIMVGTDATMSGAEVYLTDDGGSNWTAYSPGATIEVIACDDHAFRWFRVYCGTDKAFRWWHVIA